MNGVDLADHPRVPIDTLSPSPKTTAQKKAAGKKGGKTTAARRRARGRWLNPLPFMLANAVIHEPRWRGAPSAARVRALTDRYHAALARTLKHLNIPFTRGASPCVIAPFLLAGFYLARMLDQLTRPGGSPFAFMESGTVARIRYNGQTALEQGCARLAYDLFPTIATDREAWWQNCARAGDWLEILMRFPEEPLARIRRCQNPTCQTTFFFKSRRGPKNPKTCSSGCRIACFRARLRRSSPRGAVTNLRFKQNVSGLQSSRGPERSPVFTHPRLR